MLFDFFTNDKAKKIALKSAVQNADFTGETIDLNPGAPATEKCNNVVSVGIAIGVEAWTAGVFVLTLQVSDDGSTWTDIATQDAADGTEYLNQSKQNLNGVDEVASVGYTGLKRYIRVKGLDQGTADMTLAGLAIIKNQTNQTA